MQTLINKIEAAFKNLSLAIVFVDDANCVVGYNKRASEIFQCSDMIDLPASHFFPKWNELDLKFGDAYAALTEYYDRNGIARDVEVIVLPVRIMDTLARATIFKQPKER